PGALRDPSYPESRLDAAGGKRPQSPAPAPFRSGHLGQPPLRTAAPPCHRETMRSCSIKSTIWRASPSVADGARRATVEVRVRTSSLLWLGAFVTGCAALPRAV